MLQTIFYLIILILLIISIIFTILIEIERKYKQLKAFFTKSQRDNKITKVTRKDFMNLALNTMYINNRKKWFIVLSSLSFLIILFSANNSIYFQDNWVLKIISYFLILNILYAIGLYIHHSSDDLLLNSILYIIKLSILLIYFLGFFRMFLSDLNNVRTLLITIVVSIGYSFAFIKNVIDSFPSFLFQFVNFILILIINFLVIGTTFGFFYLNNHEHYQYFSEDDFQTIMQSDDLKSVYYVIYIGTIPFFNFPDKIEKSDEIVAYIPFLEHIIGYIFNLFIIGFFVSYSVSKLIERKSLKS